MIAMKNRTFGNMRAENRLVERNFATGRRATIDHLEPRRLLAAIAWTGGGDGVLWSQPLNWSLFRVPNSSDAVTINVTGDPTIQFDSTAGTVAVQSLTVSDNLKVTGGSL